MSQSSFLVAMLLAGFVLFLAARGRLGAYTAVLWGKTGQAAGGSSGGGSSFLSTLKSVAGVVKDGAELAAVVGG